MAVIHSRISYFLCRESSIHIYTFQYLKTIYRTRLCRRCRICTSRYPNLSTFIRVIFVCFAQIIIIIYTFLDGSINISHSITPRHSITCTTLTDINNTSGLWQICLIRAKVRYAAKITVVNCRDVCRQGSSRRNLIDNMCTGSFRTCQRAEYGITAEIGVEAQNGSYVVGGVGKVLGSFNSR